VKKSVEKCVLAIVKAVNVLS